MSRLHNGILTLLCSTQKLTSMLSDLVELIIAVKLGIFVQLEGNLLS